MIEFPTWLQDRRDAKDEVPDMFEAALQAARRFDPDIHTVSFPGGVSGLPLTAERWDAFDWAQFGLGPPKPTHDEVLRIVEYRRGRRLAHKFNIDRHAALGRAHFSGLSLKDSEVGSIDPGAGDHVPAVMHIAATAGRAGAVPSRVVFRSAEGPPAHVWTLRLKEHLLDSITRRANLAASAEPIIAAKYQAIAAKVREKNLAAGTIPSVDFMADFSPLYQELLDATTPAAIGMDFEETMRDLADDAALPADLDLAKEVLAERIEAAAMKRVKEIKGAKTQQGTDLPAACLDMGDALEALSAECSDGRDEIGEAVDVDAARAAYNAAIAKIAAITPLNAPEWTHSVATGSGHVVTVEAAHPADATIAGRVTLTFWAAGDGDGRPFRPTVSVTRPGGGAKVRCRAAIPPGTVYPVALEFGARNLCGPSSFALEVEDPGP